MMRDITNVQEAMVADHIAALQREGAALRAERARDRIRKQAAAVGEAASHPAHLHSRRVRIGHWLVAFGEAIAGSKRPATSTSTSIAAGQGAHDDPCGDGRDRLAPAA